MNTRPEVYVDGRVRTGGDIFKCLAMGADFVFIGRPIIWGASVGGKDGAWAILDIFEKELKDAMAYAGVSYVRDIGRKDVISREDKMVNKLSQIIDLKIQPKL